MGTPAFVAFDGAWIASVGLVSLRLGAAFATTPLLASGSAPASIRLLVVLALAVAVTLGLPQAALADAAGYLGSAGGLLAAATVELAVGAALGLGVLLAFAAFSVAGSLLGIQMGFALGQVIDPASSARGSVMTTGLNQLGLVVFVAVNGHHALLRALSMSLERFPVGHPWPVAGALGPVLWQVTGILSLGFALCAPVVFALLMVDVGLGVLGRQLPQMNMLAVGIPVKVVVGLVVLSLWMGGIGDVMSRLYGTIERAWGALFAAVPALGGEAATMAGRVRVVLGGC